MEIVVVFFVMVLLPAFIYLVTAEEIDDSLSHKIPTETSTDASSPECADDVSSADTKSRKHRRRTNVADEDAGNRRSTHLERLRWVIHKILLLMLFLLVGISVMGIGFLGLLAMLHIADNGLSAFLEMLLLIGVALKLYEHWPRLRVPDAVSVQPDERSRTDAPVGIEPATRDSTIVIEQRTFLGTLLRGILAVCGSIVIVVLLLRMKGIEAIPSWVITDAIIGFIAAAVLIRHAKSEYRIDTAARTIVHEEMTPLFVRRRNIAFKEIAAVSVRGMQRGWPLLYRYYYMEFQVVLVFDSGLVLPVFDPVKATDHLFAILDRERTRALELADLLGCPVCPWRHLGEIPFYAWKTEISRLRDASEHPSDLEKSLLETYFSSLGLGMIEPKQVKADMTTRFEMFILALVVAFFGVTTWYAVSTEWKFLAENPRVLYLILLDCTSIVVTVFGLWHFLVDEYYVFDVDAGAIEYHSRWAFWKTRRLIGWFDDIRDIRINKVLSLSSPKRQFAVEIMLVNGDRFLVSDKSPTPGVPVFRAFVLTRLLGRRIIDDPDAFENGVGDIRPIDDPPVPKPRLSGTPSWTPTGLGGILPPPAPDIPEPQGFGGRRKKSHRQKRRK